MRKVKTNFDFLNKVKNLVGTDYTFLEPYQGCEVKIKVRHNTCGYIYKTTPTNFFVGKRCCYCQHKVGNLKRTKTTDQFKEEVKELVGEEYTVLSEYTKAKNKITMRHNSCGTIYEVAPCKFLIGRRCPTCAKKNRIVHRTKDTEWFQDKLTSILGSEYLVVSKYEKANIRVKIKHTSCGHTYYKTPRIIIDAHVGCPYCGCKSKGEEYILSYLETEGINYVYQKQFSTLIDILPLSYDFYIPDKNMLIEYQGIQHYEPKEFFGTDYFNVQLKHDAMKRDFAKTNGYVLLEIPYTWNTQDKVNSFLKDNGF